MRAPRDGNRKIHLDQLGAFGIGSSASDAPEISQAALVSGIEKGVVGHSQKAAGIIENRYFGQQAIEGEVVHAFDLALCGIKAKQRERREEALVGIRPKQRSCFRDWW